MMIGSLAAYAVPGSWDYVRFMAREGTPVLGVPFVWVFVPFVLLLLALSVRSVLEVVALLRRRTGAPE
jgi:TRAP-type C4-dicarboxylate transport system permease small subunit